MSRLKEQLKRNPGLVVSGGAHALALVALVVNFSRPTELASEVETVPVEMVTSSELNDIMNGEKTAKLMDKPQRRVDKVAEVEDHKDLPPTPDAKKDTPPEPTPEKPTSDPGHDDAKEPVASAAPPPPVPAPVTPAPPAPAAPPPPPAPAAQQEAAAPPVPPEKPAAETPPTPPDRPVDKAEAPTPPPRPEDKPPPPDAEAVEPPPRPKTEPKQAKATPPKPVPLPPTHPRPVKVAKVAPKAEVPPQPPVPVPPRIERPKLFDQVASALDRMKPDKPLDKVAAFLDKLKPDPIKPPAKPRSGAEIKDAKSHDDFSIDKISALLDHEAPQRKASTGKALTQMASLGSPTGHAEKMSPSMQAQLDGWLIDHYRGCWSYFGLGGTQDYVPVLRIHMSQDGSLIGPPALVNPPSDPNLKSLADSAIRAVNKCNPLEIPARFRPYYDQGYKLRFVRFDPKEMS